MFRGLPCAILAVGALYLAASVLPCPPSRTEAQVQRSATHGGMHAQDTHSLPADRGDGDRNLAWDAPCPCQCEESRSASLGGGKLGFALISVPVGSELPAPFASLEVQLVIAPPAPFASVDPIPI